MNTFDALTDRLVAFRDVRGWKRHHTPKNLAQAIAAEAGELNHLYRWDDGGQMRLAEALEVEEGVADVMIFCLYLCEALGIDPERAIADKIAKNGRKHPEP